MMVDIETLPQPNDGFAWVQASGGPALVCRGLEPFAKHLFTTSDWQIGRRRGPGGIDDALFDQAWSQIAEAMDAMPADLVRLHQIHGATVAIAKSPFPVRPDADIVVSRNSRLALAVQSADCVPILIADRDTGAVAAAHAGWRGLAVRVPGAAIAALMREFGCRRGNLIAAIGPSIGACCYEVGADVYQRFCRSGFPGDQIERWFLQSSASDSRNPPMPGVAAGAVRDGRWFFDPWTSAADQLRASGLNDDQVFVAKLCTGSHPALFCSYRRDGSGAGRLAAAISPRSPRP